MRGCSPPLSSPPPSRRVPPSPTPQRSAAWRPGTRRWTSPWTSRPFPRARGGPSRGSSRRRGSWTRSSCGRHGPATRRCCSRSRTTAPRSAAPAWPSSCATRGPGTGSTAIDRSSPACRRSRSPANFYPAGATRDEVESWAKGLPEAERASAMGFFTAVRRAPSGGLAAVPYAVEYQGELAEASRLLREAAALTAAPTLRAFLDAARRRLPLERLPRERRRLDGARRRGRAHHRPLRDLRRRLVQRQGGLRGLRLRAGRRRDRGSSSASPASCRTSRTTCRSTRPSATRGSAALAPIRVVNEVFAAGDAATASPPPPTTCPTTRWWCRRRARSG